MQSAVNPHEPSNPTLKASCGHGSDNLQSHEAICELLVLITITIILTIAAAGNLLTTIVVLYMECLRYPPESNKSFRCRFLQRLCFSKGLHFTTNL